MGFINADTILVGHGLENDLRALKLIHNTILDTAVVFPHYYGLPYRRSLKALVSSFLRKEIQESSWGHDSYEDARACMELMLWKTRKDLVSKKLPGKSRHVHWAQWENLHSLLNMLNFLLLIVGFSLVNKSNQNLVNHFLNKFLSELYDVYGERISDHNIFSPLDIWPRISSP